IILNVILFILVAVLFYLHFNNVKKSTGTTNDNTAAIIKDPSGSYSLTIAYVNIDSLEAHYSFFQQKKAELAKEQESIQNDLGSRARTLQNEVAVLQKKAVTMTQAEGEAAQQSIIQKQQALQQREQDLRQRFMQEQQDFNMELHDRLSSFLKKYNENKHYTYILSYSEMASDILLKDTAYDITADVIKGLNAEGAR
ncbi:MAG: OmpH family outer membrane protein, partial [Chitinophagaceae bacterium]